LEENFGPSNFSRNQPKSWHFTRKHLFDQIKRIFNSTTNFSPELTKNNFGLEYSTKDSTLGSVGVDFQLFDLKST